MIRILAVCWLRSSVASRRARHSALAQSDPQNTLVLETTKGQS